MTQPVASKPRDLKYWAHVAVFLGLMLGISHAPTFSTITPMGMKVLGIFVGVLYAWTFIAIIWPSVVGLLAIMVMGVTKPEALLNKSFGDPIVVMMFFVFIFCAAVSHYGLAKYISQWFITRKCMRGRPWLFTYTFFATVMILGGLTSGTPAVLLGWSLFYGVCELCGYKKGESYTTMMIFGIVFAAQFGMSLIPFKAAPLAILGTYEKISGSAIDYAPYMVTTLIMGFILIGLLCVISNFIFRPDMSRLQSLDVTRIGEGGATRMTTEQKLVLLFLILLIGGLLAPSFLPAGFVVTRFVKSIGNTGVCMLVVVLMCCLRVNGGPLLPIKPMIDKGVAWEILLLLVFVFGISGPMRNPDSGILQSLMQALNPVFGQDSQVFFALCMGGFGLVLTQFVNNVALGTALMPIIYTYCEAHQFPPELTVIIVVISVHLAFLTPAASSPSAVLHGSDWCDTKSIWKIAPIAALLSFVVLVAFVLTIGRLFI